MNPKKYILLIILFICTTFIGCSTDEPWNSDQSNLTESTYKVNTFENAYISHISILENTATLEFVYIGKNELQLEKWFILEIYENETWYTIPYEVQVDWETIAYPVAPGQSKSLDYNWNDIYSPLSAGKYRIITKVTDYIDSDISDDTSTEYYLAKEFTID